MIQHRSYVHIWPRLETDMNVTTWAHYVENFAKLTITVSIADPDLVQLKVTVNGSTEMLECPPHPIVGAICKHLEKRARSGD